MKKLQYSPDALEKLHEIKQDITVRYGAEKAKSVIREMTKAFWDLQRFESKGPSVENLIGIPCDYRMLYVQYNYAVYRIEGDVVRITGEKKNAAIRVLERGKLMKEEISEDLDLPLSVVKSLADELQRE